MKRKIIIEILAALLFVMFAYIIFLKIKTYHQFEMDMNAQPLPNWMSPYLAAGLIILHVLIAVSLVAAKTRYYGFIAAFSLLTAYGIYVALVWGHAFSFIPCSCTWITKTMGYLHTLLFNIGYALLALGGMVAMRWKRSDASRKANHLANPPYPL